MPRRVKKECIDTIIGKSYVGDWFLFYLLGQNIDSVIFKVSLSQPSVCSHPEPEFVNFYGTQES